MSETFKKLQMSELFHVSAGCWIVFQGIQSLLDPPLDKEKG